MSRNRNYISDANTVILAEIYLKSEYDTVDVDAVLAKLSDDMDI